MNKNQIISRVKSLNLPLGQYVVFGSAPMAIHGLREVHDIDLVVKSEFYEKLKQSGEWKEKTWGHSGKKCLIKNEFEIGKNWDFGDYNPGIDRLISKAEVVDNIPFVRLEEVLKWKKVFGREKDLRDVAIIEDYLKNAI